MFSWRSISALGEASPSAVHRAGRQIDGHLPNWPKSSHGILLPSLVAKMSSNEERWNWIKGRAYYSIAGILMWATLTGKMSPHELMVLLGRLESLAVLTGR
jgi:hypothetical protein